MATFSSSRLFFCSESLIPQVTKEVSDAFQAEGFEVESCDLLAGGADISITKGGVFKSVLGMKTALKITLRPSNGRIQAEAGVGIFGQQAIPTVISMLFLWPILLTQIWGMIQQSQLDDQAMKLIEESINRHSAAKVTDASPKTAFCTQCGRTIEPGARFCSQCGAPLQVEA